MSYLPSQNSIGSRPRLLRDHSLEPLDRFCLDFDVCISFMLLYYRLAEEAEGDGKGIGAF